jgi:CxxC-x17-CxxC domain-containing protein
MSELKLKYLRGGHSMQLQDKSIVCFDCKVDFTFSVEEQEAFLAKGHRNAPKRCLSCREARKARQLSAGTYRSVQPGFYSERKMYPATCAQCSKTTQVPFEPKEGRPVYCRDCYNTIRVKR